MSALEWDFLTNTTDAPMAVDEGAFMYFSAPIVTLYDADGNDITSQQVVTGALVETNVTPEPASAVLVGTGFFAIVGVTRRRRAAMQGS